MIELDFLEQVDGQNDQHDLVLFALSTCGWCRKARGYLEDNDLKYEYVYVDQLEGDRQEKAIEEIKAHNPKMTFPTLVIDGEDVITGFNEPMYEEKLN